MARLTPAGNATHALVAEIGLTVRSGPFTGMALPPSARGHASFIAAKLLGCYECELHAALGALIAGVHEQIVDIGAAEGYYAVGLAMCTPDHVRVEAFETDAGSRRLCREMAELNGVVDRLHIRGFCDQQVLSRTLTEHAAVLCDCEGYEHELLDPSLVPQLASATIVAELHPFVHGDIERTISSRFAPTHDVAIVHPSERKAGDWRELEGRDARTAFLLLSEGAPSPAQLASFRRSWAVMTPRRR